METFSDNSRFRMTISCRGIIIFALNPLIMKTLFLSFSALLLLACNQQTPDTKVADPVTAEPMPVSLSFKEASNRLAEYWYQGKAEISRYALQQNRYQDIHPGEVVMIFVTEDFLTDRQVKNDHYKNPNSIPILKNNIVKNFTTGVYKYSIMSSVFTPVNQQKELNTLKVTTTSQDWCGHTFMQVNFKEGRYHAQIRSYFETEGDQDIQVEGVVLEEELYNRIRINPAALPLGKFRLLPGAEYVRLAHKPYQAAEVEATLEGYAGADFEGQGLQSYKVQFKESGRVLEIIFESGAPYLIQGWKDTYPSLMDRESRTTLARRTHTILDDYWKHNRPADNPLREQLGLGRD